MYVFGNYILDVDERRLLRDNEEVRLRGKLFDTLRVLVENAGKLGRGKEPRHMQPQRLQDYGSHIRLTPSDA